MRGSDEPDFCRTSASRTLLGFPLLTTFEGDMDMNLRKTLVTTLFTTLFIGLFTSGQHATAQTFPRVSSATLQASSNQIQNEKVDDETNLDTQLYMLIATNQDVDDTKLP